MSPHPYEKYLDGRDPLRCLEETPQRIAASVRGWPAAAFGRSYAPGKWTAAQILVHLAQAEMVFGTRLRFALADSGYAIQPFDQDSWIAVEPAPAGLVALNAYVGLRGMTLALCRGLTPGQRARTATHPEFGTISVEWLIGWLAGHELNHLPQIEIIAAA